MATNNVPRSPGTPDEEAGTARTGDARGSAPPASGRATDRSFVVQLAPGLDPAGDDLHGRVQHLATSDGGNFASLNDLVAIMRRVLARARDD